MINANVLNIAPKKLKCIFLVHDLSSGFFTLIKEAMSSEIAENIIHIPRLPYVDFMHLIKGAEFMVTDGGSNQEEMYYMGKPCLVLRNNTERIEGLKKNVILRQNKGKTSFLCWELFRSICSIGNYRSSFGIGGDIGEGFGAYSREEI